MTRLTIAILLACSLQSFGQTSLDAHRALEKYWYYRYRLVNDFMNLGTGPGETIPAQKRWLSNPSDFSDSAIALKPEDFKPYKKLSFEEPTLLLGHYMGVLATERRQAKRFGGENSNARHLGLDRSEWELNLALDAFERLDRYSESYSHHVWQNDPQGYPGHMTTFPESTDLNGFFLRDDVPWEDLVEDNYAKFNRPAIDPTRRIWSTVDYCWKDRYNGEANPNRNNDPYPPNYTDKVPGSVDHFRAPNEESQDQIVGLTIGMGLTISHVGMPSHPLRDRAADNLHRMLRHVERNGVTFSPHIGFGFSPWIIHNPAHDDGFWFPYIGGPAIMTKHWVHPEPSSQPDAGGAWMGPSAKGLADASLWLTSNYGADNFAGSWIMNQRVSPAHRVLYWLSQWGSFHRDWHFPATYAAFTKNWRALPFTGLLSPNTTWASLCIGSLSNCQGAVHMPLLYRLQHHGVGNGIGNFNPGALPGRLSYEELLNLAPPCGPYLYNDGVNGTTASYWHYEWSGSDRLHEFYHRYHATQNTDCHEANQAYHSEFNGIDYMLLFNLYTLASTSALNKYFNSYYSPNFAKTFPDPVGGEGSYSRKLYLQYLEYLSLKNKIESNGWVSFRGGKVVELLPGFEAKAGSTFEAYVKDYSCFGDPEVHGGEEYWYSRLLGRDGVTRPTDYYTDEPTETIIIGSKEAGDDSAELTIAQFDSLQSSPDFHQAVDSALAVILSSDDTLAQQTVAKWYVSDSASRAERGLLPIMASYPKIKKRFAKGREVQQLPDEPQYSLFPNPTTGTFAIHFPRAAQYTITVSTVTGQVVHTSQVSTATSQVSLQGLAPGGYTVTVQSVSTTRTFKVTLLPE